MIDSIFSLLLEHDARVGQAINLVASENRLSPAARIALLSDVYGRYFLDDLKLFGTWCFHGGKQVCAIEHEILHPLLQRLARAEYVNTRPISGINCMAVALAATSEPGDSILTLAMAHGGHASTRVIAGQMGRKVHELPMLSPHDIDLDAFVHALESHDPALVYIDQATLLFPLDVAPLREAIDGLKSRAIVHYDSSHLNGLILGGATANPLERGAHMFGGSTHKTLPGPHKGFLVTNDERLASRIDVMASHLISHHHSGEAAALAITLAEFESCGGPVYSARVIENARAFAGKAHRGGLLVAEHDRGFTSCHQVWLTPPQELAIADLAVRLEACGIVVNSFQGLPGISAPSFRISLAEATRMGATTAEAEAIADLFVEIIGSPDAESDARTRGRRLASRLSVPHYCVKLHDIDLPGLKTYRDQLRSFLGDPA